MKITTTAPPTNNIGINIDEESSADLGFDDNLSVVDTAFFTKFSPL